MSMRYNENDVGISANNILTLATNGVLPAVNGSNLTNLTDTSNAKYVATEVKSQNFTVEANKLYIIIANNITITVPTTMNDYNVWGFVNFGKFTTTVSLPANHIIRNINSIADTTTTYQTTSDKSFKEFVVAIESTNTIHYIKNTYNNKLYECFDDVYRAIATGTSTKNILAYFSTKTPGARTNSVASLMSQGFQFFNLNYRSQSFNYQNTFMESSNFKNFPLPSFLFFWKKTTATLTLNQLYHDPLNNPGYVLLIHLSPPDSGSTWVQRTITCTNGYSIDGFTTVVSSATYKHYQYLKLISDGTKDWKIIESSDDWTLS